ncbi:MAG TPA: hypothetical protein PKG60_01815 [Spirochaetota bacterium]|nr:hypothetical protein [Spirochaetota bacterium]HPS86707.1 hypothetical protein [Spirochaetota bacterium]
MDSLLNSTVFYHRVSKILLTLPSVAMATSPTLEIGETDKI